MGCCWVFCFFYINTSSFSSFQVCVSFNQPLKFLSPFLFQILLCSLLSTTLNKKRTERFKTESLLMMALETVVYPQDTFSYVCRDFSSYAGGPPWGTYDYAFQFEEQKAFLGLIENQTQDQKWEPSPDESSINHPLPGGGSLYPPLELEPTPPPPPPTTGRRKRRRTRSTKNKEEIENQRMTHIAVERNRRKQMNEYLAVLRSLMPSSYVQRVSFLSFS